LDDSGPTTTRNFLSEMQISRVIAAHATTVATTTTKDNGFQVLGKTTVSLQKKLKHSLFRGKKDSTRLLFGEGEEAIIGVMGLGLGKSY
jgi:hypothetical protein